ncbi:MAG: hypothetical protein RJA16_768 [Planctomycetota bacterium]
MRLLLDENLSESVAERIAADFPGVVHVRREIGTGAADSLIWEYAKRTAAAIVTLDEDFQSLSIIRGSPPKVIWIDAHNPRSEQVARLLIDRRERLQAFLADEDSSLLVLTLPRRG